jgi:hypothetical protein
MEDTMALTSRIALVTWALAATAVTACSGSDGGSTNDVTNDSGVAVHDSGSSPTDTGATPIDAPPAATIHVRIAHLSPDAPNVEVCVKGKGKDDSTYVGPIFKTVGIAGGLAFGQVTAYLDLPAGAYTARIVAPDATSCAKEILPGTTYDLPDLPGGAYATALAIGRVGGATKDFTVHPVVDTHDAPSTGNVRVRFFHASPDTPSVDVGLVSSSFTAIWSDVSFGAAKSAESAIGTSDANAFVSTAAPGTVVVGARATGTTAIALKVDAPLAGGKVLSTFAIGLLGGTGSQALSVLACDDLAPASGGLSACTRLSAP